MKIKFLYRLFYILDVCKIILNYNLKQFYGTKLYGFINKNEHKTYFSLCFFILLQVPMWTYCNFITTGAILYGYIL